MFPAWRASTARISRGISNIGGICEQGGRTRISGDTDVFKDTRKEQEFVLASEAGHKRIEINRGLGNLLHSWDAIRLRRSRTCLRSSLASSVATCRVVPVSSTWEPPVVGPTHARAVNGSAQLFDSLAVYGDAVKFRLELFQVQGELQDVGVP